MDEARLSNGIHRDRVKSGGWHKTVFVVYEDQSEYIDEGIAPLIYEMWRAGIRTYQSCEQGASGRVWLQFDDSVALEQFLSIVGNDELPGRQLNVRMRHGYGRTGGRNQWRYFVVVNDLSVDEERDDDGRFVDNRTDVPDFYVLLCVEFPQKDLPTVLSRLVARNAAHDGAEEADSAETR